TAPGRTSSATNVNALSASDAFSLHTVYRHGPKRNEEMVKQCDLVICFWDGKSKGTKSLIQFAKKYGKTVMTKLI
ncbi:MAG: hypothetical protein IKI29_00120, partial [Clostridia bacterium]|nr:hypothetical protein [Clostridia bacterium]